MGGMCDRGCAWQGVMLVGRCAWQGLRGRGACVAWDVGDTATAADGKHPTAMHSCSG